MRISGPDSRNSRSGQAAGNWSVPASGPRAATTRSKYARSAVATAVHAAGTAVPDAAPSPAPVAAVPDAAPSPGPVAAVPDPAAWAAPVAMAWLGTAATLLGTVAPRPRPATAWAEAKLYPHASQNCPGRP